MGYAGRSFRVYVQIADVWTPIEGERTSVGSVSTEQVDVTSRGDVPWRSLLDCGIRAASVSCDGVVYDKDSKALFSWLMSLMFNGETARLKIVNEAEYGWLEGEYVVTSIEQSGEYNGAETYRMQFDGGTSVQGYVPPPVPEHREPGLAYLLTEFSDSSSTDLARPDVYRQCNDWTVV